MQVQIKIHKLFNQRWPHMRTPSPTERTDIPRECSPPRAHRNNPLDDSIAQTAKRTLPLPPLEFEASTPKARKISNTPPLSDLEFITQTPEKAFGPVSFGDTSQDDSSIGGKSLDDEFIVKPDASYNGFIARSAAAGFPMFRPSLGKPAPKQIVTGPIPLAEIATIDTWDFDKKAYLKARNEVQEHWEITTQTGVKVPLERSAFGEGNYARSYSLQAGAETFYSDIENERIICKMYRDSDARGHIISHKEILFCSIRQYKALEQDFAGLTEETKPYAKIYNEETVAIDGYVLQEKVLPLGKIPTWNKDTLLEDLSEKDRSILAQIKELFHYSYCKQVQNPNWKGDMTISSSSKDSYVSPKTISAPGLDLSLSNLGIREGTNTVVIFDFREDDDTFSIHASCHLRNLSWGNIAIRDYLLEGLGEKVRGNVDLEFYYNDLISSL